MPMQAHRRRAGSGTIAPGICTLWQASKCCPSSRTSRIPCAPVATG